MSEIFQTCSRRRPSAWAPRLILAAFVAGAAWTAGCNDRRPDSHDRHDHGAAGHGDEGGGKASDEHGDEVVVSAEGQKRWGVRVDVAAKAVLRSTFEVPARVSFNQERVARVGALLRGRVTEIKARLGDEVKTGDELLVVESPELGEAQADYLTRIAAVKSAAPKVDVARSLFERARALQQDDAIVARSEVDRREMELREAEAIHQAAGFAVEAAESRLRLLGMTAEAIAALRAGGAVSPRLGIRAPAAGQVVEREVTVGELVGPESHALLVLADTLSVWVLADVPEGRLKDVERGAKVIVRGAGPASDGVEGVVTYIAPAVHRDTRAGEVRVEVAQAGGRLVPGMFARAEITAVTHGELHEPVIAVPEAALQTIEGKPCLFVPVKDEENTFSKRPVAVGRPVGGMVPVHSGLDEGEAFVAAGTFILKAELAKGSAEHQH